MDDKKQIIITRIFDAPRELVWKAWTNPELVKKWWGPEGFSAPSAKVDLQVGGKYIYAMHGPAGSQWDRDMYSAGIFKEIVPMEKIVVTDYFSDENGNLIDPTEEGQSPEMPREMHATILFEDVENGKTKLSIIYTPETAGQYEVLLKSGMQEGWGTSLNKFAQALAEEE